jgi:hypothetical protein
LRTFAARSAAVATSVIGLGLAGLTVACGNDANARAGLQGGSGSGGQGTTLNVPLSGNDSGGAGCEREVSLQPVTLGAPQPFDLVIVADHSDSLAWSRDALASGLRDLLANVRGRAARVFLLTPTQYGASSAISPLPTVAWRDPETGEPYGPAATTYNQQCTDGTGTIISCPDVNTGAYHLEGRWDFTLPEPIAVITPSLSDSEFVAQQAAVSAAVLGIVGSGSPTEQPLCTLGRYVSQAPAKLPKNVAFLLISDEDDTTRPHDCLVAYEKDVTAKQVVSATIPCNSDCDEYKYTIDVVSRTFQTAIGCVAVTDTGQPIPGTEKTVSGPFNSGCDGAVPGPCPASEQDLLASRCGNGYRIASCEHKCVEDARTCDFTTTQPTSDCSMCTPSGVKATGPCTAKGGVNYQYTTSYSETVQKVPLMTGTETQALASYFVSTAKSVLGPTHYLVQGILLDPAFSCPLGPGQSYGDNLARMIGDRSRVFPLCESYGPALAGVLDFAQALIQTDFELSLESDEDVTAITVAGADGKTRTLTPEQYTFDKKTGALHVDPSAIVDTDTDLRVEVTSACRPIVQ